MKMFRTLVATAVLLAAAPMAWAEDPVGHWTGELASGQGPVTVGITISRGADGKFIAVGESAMSPSAPIPIDAIASDGAKLSFTATAASGAYEGVWDAALKGWKGVWKQGAQNIPLLLKRAAT